ncbi:RING finger nhl-1 isoform X1 [Brachionus plicatilis]|uniref:RING finger nhl-1 isoform X1 n=1 Tax=Brachionus plicatilis TaxID=10195 RepID=A0A3M7SLQ6_BRAPC|nr:RING finger nhl-1 isoform X1 [Brachionus plicatilis]
MSGVSINLDKSIQEPLPSKASINLNASSKKMININSFLDELKCPICLELFQNARTLKCQHSFCSKCLEPLVKERIFSCPQCRNSCYYDAIDKIPKNSLLSNLVENIKLTKAACPQCKELTELVICEHCSQIFCDSCQQKHMESTLEKLDNRLVTMETLPKIVETLKSNIDKAEQDTMLKVVSHMEKLQSQILQLWQARKYTLIDEIRRFYKTKTEEIDMADFRLKVMTRTINEMNERKNKLESSFGALTTNCKSTGKFYTELAQFEQDLTKLESKFREAFSNFNINNDELKLQFNQLDNFKLLESILKNVKLIVADHSEEMVLDNFANPTKCAVLNQIQIGDYFGNSALVSLDAGKNETIENLKQKIKFLLGVEPKNINLINKKTNQKLDDKLVLVFKDGNVYAKQEGSDSPTDQDQVELFVSYKCHSLN